MLYIYSIQVQIHRGCSSTRRIVLVSDSLKGQAHVMEEQGVHDLQRQYTSPWRPRQKTIHELTWGLVLTPCSHRLSFDSCQWQLFSGTSLVRSIGDDGKTFGGVLAFFLKLTWGMFSCRKGWRYGERCWDGSTTDLLAWFSYDDGCAWEIGGSCGGGTVMVEAVVVAALKKFVIAGVVRWWWWWVVWWWGM